MNKFTFRTKFSLILSTERDLVSVYTGFVPLIIKSNSCRFFESFKFDMTMGSSNGNFTSRSKSYFQHLFGASLFRSSPNGLFLLLPPPPTMFFSPGSPAYYRIIINRRRKHNATSKTANGSQCFRDTEGENRVDGQRRSEISPRADQQKCR